jgi:ribosome-associated translation inhibitor RaiA
MQEVSAFFGRRPTLQSRHFQPTGDTHEPGPASPGVHSHPRPGSGRAARTAHAHLNGARGGIDKGCLVTLHLSGERRALVATELDADLYRAIPAAFDKLRRAVGQTAHRTRTLRRRPSSLAPKI